MGVAISHDVQQGNTAINFEAVFGPLQSKSAGTFASSHYRCRNLDPLL